MRWEGGDGLGVGGRGSIFLPRTPLLQRGGSKVRRRVLGKTEYQERNHARLLKRGPVFGGGILPPLCGDAIPAAERKKEVED